MSNEIKKITTDKPCCEVFKLTAEFWKWFVMQDAPDVLAMPFITSNSADYRVNFCPSCGADIRTKIYDRTDLFD